VGGTFAYGINDIEHQLDKEREREGERIREENCYRPSTGLAEVSVTQVSVKGLTERSERSVVAVALPVAGSASLYRLGFPGGFLAVVEPYVLSPWPPPSLYRHCAMGAHQPGVRLSAPDQSMSQGLTRSLDRVRWTSI
jgi:hypothetical protein